MISLSLDFFGIEHLAFTIVLAIGVVILARGKIHLVLVLTLIGPLNHIVLFALNLMELEDITDVLATASNNLIRSKLQIKLIGLDIVFGDVVWLSWRRNIVVEIFLQSLLSVGPQFLERGLHELVLLILLVQRIDFGNWIFWIQIGQNEIRIVLAIDKVLG